MAGSNPIRIINFKVLKLLMSAYILLNTCDRYQHSLLYCTLSVYNVYCYIYSQVMLDLHSIIAVAAYHDITKVLLLLYYRH
jgi:hypothetical protein